MGPSKVQICTQLSRMRMEKMSCVCTKTNSPVMNILLVLCLNNTSDVKCIHTRYVGLTVSTLGLTVHYVGSTVHYSGLTVHYSPFHSLLQGVLSYLSFKLPSIGNCPCFLEYKGREHSIFFLTPSTGCAEELLWDFVNLVKSGGMTFSRYIHHSPYLQF